MELSIGECKFLNIFPKDKSWISLKEIIELALTAQISEHDAKVYLQKFDRSLLKRHPTETMMFSIINSGLLSIKEYEDADTKLEEERLGKKEIEDLDRLQKQFTYKVRYVPFIFSGFALIVSAIAIAISIRTCNRQEGQKQTGQTSKMKEQATTQTFYVPK